MTAPLETLLIRRIAQAGPVGIAAFMAEALGHPRHGYYITRDPLGVEGDFTTAPEISQMFGEMLGVWLADAWICQGRPNPVHLVEPGPGRGTLMADALRATARVPGFHTAIRLHLVETSPVLRRRQAAALPAFAPQWHDNLADVPEGPLLLVANEFFDALPIRQFIRTPAGWAERKVGLDAAGRLAFTVDPGPGGALLTPLHQIPGIPPGAIAETCPAGMALTAEIGRRLATHGGAALIIDYGYDGPAIGDTLQAVRAHRPVPVLDAPGTADLTAHVDFTALARAAADAGATCHPGIGRSVGQGALLRALGIEARAATLAARVTPAQQDAIGAALDRLTGPDAMGRLFRAIALTGPGAPVPAGFAPEPETASEPEPKPDPGPGPEPRTQGASS
ncbi:SAM-dependent methyltransferase [Niveispirillum fermenti]|uniref:class I SAM-dependent methyltransferase n=1 Tax=Niveispirillum fermenti TaxID=1233113 RepID=UPI003A8563BB